MSEQVLTSLTLFSLCTDGRRRWKEHTCPRGEFWARWLWQCQSFVCIGWASLRDTRWRCHQHRGKSTCLFLIPWFPHINSQTLCTMFSVVSLVLCLHISALSLLLHSLPPILYFSFHITSIQPIYDVHLLLWHSVRRTSCAGGTPSCSRPMLCIVHCNPLLTNPSLFNWTVITYVLSNSSYLAPHRISSWSLFICLSIYCDS